MSHPSWSHTNIFKVLLLLEKHKNSILEPCMSKMQMRAQREGAPCRTGIPSKPGR